CNDWIVFTSAVLPGTAASQQSTATTPAATEPAAAEPAATAPAAEPAATEAASTDAVAAAFAGLPETTPSDTADSVVHPHGVGSHAALRDGAQPAGFPIKGNASSNLYHLPGTAFYGRTDAEVWFATEAD